MAFFDFLSFLAGMAYVSGDLEAKKRKREKAEASMPSERELKLLRDFGENFMADISLSLGRPYKHEFPEYLKKNMENLGWSYSKINEERGKWLLRSKNGILDYLAKKEGWIHRFRFVTTESPQELIEEQETFLSWYNEAQSLFPHYATSQVYIEDYPTKSMYFEGIQQYRKTHSEIEGIFGDVNESDDPEYDKEIRRLFYSIDPKNKLGGIEMKYVVFRYVKLYEYKGKDWENIKKLYTSLSRIAVEEGYDPRDLLIKDGLFSYITRHSVVDTYYSRPISSAKIRDILTIIEKRRKECEVDNENGKLEYVIHIEALKLLLRIDGYDPTHFGL